MSSTKSAAVYTRVSTRAQLGLPEKQLRYAVTYDGKRRFVNAGSATEAIDKLRVILLAVPLKEGETRDECLANRELFRNGSASAKVSMRG